MGLVASYPASSRRWRYQSTPCNVTLEVTSNKVASLGGLLWNVLFVDSNESVSQSGVTELWVSTYKNIKCILSHFSLFICTSSSFRPILLHQLLFFLFFYPASSYFPHSSPSIFYFLFLLLFRHHHYLPHLPIFFTFILWRRIQVTAVRFSWNYNIVKSDTFPVLWFLHCQEQCQHDGRMNL